MKKFFLIFIFLYSPAFAQKTLVLSLGESYKLPLKGSSSVWIQDRDILQADGGAGNLSVKGNKEGKTTVKVGSDIYYVHVVHPVKKASLKELQDMLGNIIGLNTEISEGDLLVRGQLYRLKDWIKLSQFAEDRNLGFQMRARMSAELQNEVQNHFQELLSTAKLPPQTLIFEPQLEVRISAADLLVKKYQKLLSPYGIAIIKDESSLQVEPTVKVQITVAEIRRDLSVKYGLKWPQSYTATILSDGSKEVSDLPFSLNALENQGQAKILASPNILCRSGKEAEFLAGGEFPIKILNFKAQDVVWKRYGILLRVKPKADAAGRISLSIETEVSTLDKSMQVDDIPGILTNRVSSHFDLTKPQTIALSGLIKSEDGKASEGLPLLSRLPIIGALFSSKDFRENRTELVIFVRPTILGEQEQTMPQAEHLRQGT
ncbi:type II and III secretion system protein family protein [Bdellovibrio reynosensis]|uniref:Pilus assembly protein n=1 Tax=Bdellovibrio reynosensis TaxID=2835041 RepID=A0ABY4CB85_9BACT|nr:pilus assembly protein [Bdellovibrio reynosensis]UOF00956.1 pilus assembly protein [Bdellovibrio reynosensis]